ncbi:DUF4468 domain-containing protein [uncultured Bacteroides sp.]|uniref:DUF4468 domain-containing protein n=1 Tax=uncultured Bacteroides sp. TaxID=162156 RepID=UPI002AAB0DFA|nr:DUF4468 domain-containing protein [uncultured Bacteroides sp.]
MKKSAFLLVLFIFCLPVMIQAQENESENSKNYLAGAVPEKDGRVVFSKEFNLSNLSKDQVFDKMLDWMGKQLKKNNNTSRVIYSDKEKGIIAGYGEEYLVFKSGSLSLDRTLIKYQIKATCLPEKCIMNIEKIYYDYEKDKKIPAEEQITDKEALNKDKTKLIRGTAKFRIKTVDFADAVFTKLQTTIGAAPIVAQVTETSLSVAGKPDVSSISSISEGHEASSSASGISGYKQIAPDKISGNIIKMLSENWMLITAGDKDKFNMMTASWGGLGFLYQKPVAFCFINPTRYTYQLMENNDTYTLSFYTEAYRDALKYCGSNSGKDVDKVKGSGLTPIATPTGSKAFSQAWLIIECRKMVAQSLQAESISDKSLKENWTGKQMHKMYIGEIINVWVK